MKFRPQVLIHKINQSYALMELDDKCEWLRSLLDEVHEDVDTKDPEFDEAKIKISFTGSLRTKDQGKLGEFAILQGDLNLNFYTYDIHSSELMLDSLQLPIRSIYMDEDAKEEYGYEEETSFLFDNTEYDLFFYSNQLIDIKEVLHEYIYLNKNPYPTQAQANEHD